MRPSSSLPKNKSKVHQIYAIEWFNKKMWIVVIKKKWFILSEFETILRFLQMFKVVNKLELLLRTDKAGFRDADASKKWKINDEEREKC